MQPNIFLNNSFGKVVFILFDIVCGCLILKINQNEHSKPDNIDKKMAEQNQLKNNLIPICFWFYNPITIAIGKFD